MRRFTMRMNVLCAALLFVAACGDDDPAPAATPTADVVESDATGDACLLYTSPSPRDRQKSRMPSSA